MPKLIIANWKQNNDIRDTKLWFSEFTKHAVDLTQEVRVIIAPTFPTLHIAAHFSRLFHNIFVSGQNVSRFEDGAHTGEVGVKELKDYADYCIIGHSERAEPKDEVFQKRDLCLNYGIVPIICFIDPADAFDYYVEGVVLALEDPKNISSNGKYNPMNVDECKAAVQILKKELGVESKIVYGGSVNKTNSKDLSRIDELDGVLVGNASLDPDHFFEIIQSFE